MMNNRRAAFALLCPLLFLAACAKTPAPSEMKPATPPQSVAHKEAGESEEVEANEGNEDVTPAALASPSRACPGHRRRVSCQALHSTRQRATVEREGKPCGSLADGGRRRELDSGIQGRGREYLDKSQCAP